MKAKNELITLQVIDTVQNTNGFPTESVVDSTEVFAEIESVKRTEFNQAQREGIKLSITATIGYEDWLQSRFKIGEKLKVPSKVLVDEIPYNIYRTYRTNDYEIELVLEEIE